MVIADVLVPHLHRLVGEPQSWVHRRVETISYLGNGEARRHVSVDFTLPARYLENCGDTVLVPLGFLKKQPLARFDMRDSQGESLPVLGTRENGEVAERLLRHALSTAFGAAIAEQNAEQVRGVVFADPAGAGLAVAALKRGVGAFEAAIQAEALRLAGTLAASFLLLVECRLQSVSGRSIVKFQYEDAMDLGGGAGPIRGRRTLTLEDIAVSEAASFHLEVRAPDGLVAQRLLVQQRGQATEAFVEHGRGVLVHAHVPAPDGPWSNATHGSCSRPSAGGWSTGRSGLLGSWLSLRCCPKASCGSADGTCRAAVIWPPSPWRSRPSSLHCLGAARSSSWSLACSSRLVRSSC